MHDVADEEGGVRSREVEAALVLIVVRHRQNAFTGVRPDRRQHRIGQPKLKCRRGVRSPFEDGQPIVDLDLPDLFFWQSSAPLVDAD